MRTKRSMALRFVGVMILVLVASLAGVSVLTGMSPTGLLRLLAPPSTLSGPNARLPRRSPPSRRSRSTPTSGSTTAGFQPPSTSRRP